MFARLDDGRCVTYALLYLRPIPQWFRLKTDTKIQVRLAVILRLINADNLRSFSTMPSAVIGGERNSTSKCSHFVGKMLLLDAVLV